MKSISRTLNTRHKRLARARRSLVSRVGLGCSAVISLAVLLLVFAALAGYASLTRSLPSLQALPNLLSPPDGSLLQPTRLYDRSGSHLILTLENPGAAGREYVALNTLPQVLVDAYLAVFEPAFWQSPGYSLDGLGEPAHPAGDSQPIAQRLASDLLLWEEPASLRRSLRQRLLAAQLIRQFGHEQVLEWDLNSRQFGPLVYGVDAAARVFFGKSAMTLNLGEATFLVAAAISPDTAALELPQVVLEQQKTVLEKMLVQNLITSQEMAQAILVPQSLRSPVSPPDPAPAFTHLVLEQLSAYYPIQRLQRGGLRVITTLDYDLQLQALCTSAVHLERLSGAPAAQDVLNGQSCQAARLLPTLPLQETVAAGALAINALVLDTSTSQVLAMVGEPARGLDPAHAPGHPAGSLLTPFVYLAGFTRGLSPGSLVWDLPPDRSTSLDAQASVDLSLFHGPLRLRTALANDYLSPAWQLVQQLGSETVYRLTQELGLDSLAGLPAGSEAVFDQPVVLLDIAHTFSIFANQGTLIGQAQAADQGDAARGSALASLQPGAVLRLEDWHGRVWLDWSVPEKQAILAPQLSYLMADVLSDETARWPFLGHPNPLEIGRPAAAKLGLSSDGSSAWSIGFTPQRLAAIWIGYPQPQAAQVTPEMPAALWHALMQYASRGMPSLGWEMPAGIRRVTVCDPSGMLPTENCPNVVNEIFLAGSEPVQQDTLYQTFQVNRETGLLATVFTPAEMVQERVYLVVPADAVEWARQAGVPIPPASYDSIYVAAAPSTDARIDAPSMFGHVRGRVTITGHAGGEGFDFYRLQVGQGLNPQAWLQISEGMHTPVTAGALGEWQTAGLNGLYTLQLLVVRQDQSVAKAILQVTVDNTAPQVAVLHPADGQTVRISSTPQVLLQAEASDDLQLSRLEFYIDERLVATLIDAPFNILWQGQPGKHALKIIAYDLAGNSAQDTTSFELLR